MLYSKVKKIINPKDQVVLIVMAGLTMTVNNLKEPLKVNQQLDLLFHRAILPTLPQHNLPTILTGAPLEFHGISNFTGEFAISPVLMTKFKLYPTFFYSLKNQKPHFKTSMITNHLGVENIVEKPLIDHFQLQTTIDFENIKLDFQELLVIYDTSLYDVGVKQGFDSNDYQLILQEKIKQINLLIDNHQAATFILTTTSGGVHQGLENQGGLENQELLIPLKIIDFQTPLNNKKITTPTSNTDIATMIAYLMNFDLVQSSSTNASELLHKAGFLYA